jgi:DNA (cytosine-5)-methyltransferase 1
MKLISLFTGAGGLDLGLETAGFSIHGAIELDAISRSTLVRNRHWKLASKNDIFSYTPDELRREFGFRRKEVELISAGPPCQPFSKAGYWVNGSSLRMKDPRAQTIKASMDIIEEFLPMVFLLENVTGIAYKQKDEGLLYIKRRLYLINKNNKCRYNLQVFSINSAHYGVPQIRTRIFMVATRDGTLIDLPSPTHHITKKDYQVNPKSLPFNNAWDALHNVNNSANIHDLKVTGKWAELLPSIPEGSNYLWHTNKKGGEPLFHWRSKYWSFLLKLAKDKPSWTIQAQPGPATGPFHWENRKLSVPELLSLQTFPNGYKIEGSHRECVKQIGNAVPSAIGELFGLEIRRQVFKQRVRKNLRLIPMKLGQPPKKEKTQPVKKSFYSLLESKMNHF